MRVVLGVVITNTRLAAVNVRAAERLSVNIFAGCSLDQRRPTEKYASLISDNHVFIRHCRDIGASGSARAMHYGDLCDTRARQCRLVVEAPPDVISIREHFILRWQKCPTALDQVNTRKPVVTGDLLRPQVLL